MPGKLLELVDTDGRPTFQDAVWAYSRTIAAELFPDSHTMARNATIGSALILLEEHSQPHGRTIVPKGLEPDQVEDWFAGQVVWRALVTNKELESLA